MLKKDTKSPETWYEFQDKVDADKAKEVKEGKK